MLDKLTQCSTFNSLPGNLSLSLPPQYKQDRRRVSVGLLCGSKAGGDFWHPCHPSPQPPGQINGREKPPDTLSPVDRSEGHVLPTGCWAITPARSRSAHCCSSTVSNLGALSAKDV